MRKALMGLIMAATVMTPIAAEAQRGDRSGHYQRMEQRNQQRYGGQRNEARPQNREARPQNREARPQYQPREQRPARQVQVQPAQTAPVAAVQRDGRRGGGEGYRGQRGTSPQQGYRAQQATPPQQGYRAQQGTRAERGNRGNSGNSGYQRGWQGPNTPGNQRDADRYNRRAQENAIRYGTPAQRRDAVRDARRDDRRDWRNDRRDDRRDWRGDRRADNRNWNRDWNRGWRNDRRYDWQRWRYSNRNVYRLPAYYAPYRGWNYSRFSIGFMLQPLFYSQRYWIGDPWQYRLPAAPYGTQWVRYYNDVLLVDTYTGEVVDVIYDFFW